MTDYLPLIGIFMGGALAGALLMLAVIWKTLGDLDRRDVERALPPWN